MGPSANGGDGGLEACSSANPGLDTAVMPAARRAWGQMCWDGISESATQYWRLHQAEANGPVRELEQVLSTLNDLDRARADQPGRGLHVSCGAATAL